MHCTQCVHVYSAGRPMLQPVDQQADSRSVLHSELSAVELLADHRESDGPASEEIINKQINKFMKIHVTITFVNIIS